MGRRARGRGLGCRWRGLGPWRWLLLGAAAVGLAAVFWEGAHVGKDVYDGQRVSSYRALIERESSAAGLDAGLVGAVVRAESGGDARAVSRVGALGLMQVRPSTADEVKERFGLGDGDLLDPAFNVRVGTRYLAYLLDRFEGDTLLAVAAYHMGPTRLAKLRRTHPELTSAELVRAHAGPQTRAYVRKVLGPGVI